MSDRGIWLTEVEQRLWFLPDVASTAAGLLAQQVPAPVAAARWQDALAGAFGERIVDEALVERVLDELVTPALAAVPRVFSDAEADDVVERLLIAAVGDLAERFCAVNGPAVAKVALGLAAMGRGDDRGEGELSEGLAQVVGGGVALIEGLRRSEALDAARSEVAAEASDKVARREGGDIDELARLRGRLEEALRSGALTDPERSGEMSGLVRDLEEGVHALEAATTGGLEVDTIEE